MIRRRFSIAAAVVVGFMLASVAISVGILTGIAINGFVRWVFP